MSNCENSKSLQGFLWHNSREWVRIPHYCWVEMEISSPHGAYCHHSGWALFSASSDRNASSTWLSLIFGVLECIIQPHKARSLYSPFSLLLVGAGVGSEVFCGVWLVDSSYCLQVLLLIACPFPGSLDRESNVCWGYFCLQPMTLLNCQLLSQIWDEAKRKSRQFTTVSFLGSWCPELVCLLLSTFSETSYVSFIYNMQSY